MSAFDHTLWYRKPAQAWTEALPLGNGRLGAMIFGGVTGEQLQINEETLWSGGPYEPINPDALPHLAEVRQLIFDGNFAEAEALANRFSMARPLQQMSYQPAGDLWLDFAHDGAEDYRRELDLDRAVATVSYVAGGVRFLREAFISPVDQILVLCVTASTPGALSATIRLTSEQPGESGLTEADTLFFAGTNRPERGIAAALRFAIRARVANLGGSLTAESGGLKVANADRLVVLLDAATSFRRFDDVSGDPEALVRTRLAAAAGKAIDAMRAAHEAEHRRLYRRVTIDLGATAAAALPTDERIARSPEQADPALAALYVQYGRYLMISSSRPGTQPANLQGIWNNETEPPWGSKYTANINLQMNYWLADVANLAECFEPLIGLTEEVAVTGARMARAHYDAPGWVLHHNTDLWRATGPIDGAKWGLWPMGGAWLCVQLWDHLAYSDGALIQRLYPLIKGATDFFLHVLVQLPGSDLLVTNPSLSPENVHPHGAALCAGPTMDNQILRDLFGTFAQASTLLGVDEDMCARALWARDHLPPHRIGGAGQLQEWIEDWDMAVPELDHRHVSHLYGLYPSFQIDREETSSLAAAARRSLEIRGDDATGWGIGWRINLWARLGDGDHAHDVVALLLGPERTYPNMFDAHPPFQIDGNFGGAAGILEMLVQSRPGHLRLLPALPRAWPSGRVSGIRARGGIELCLAWQDHALSEATLVLSTAGRTRVTWGSTEIVLNHDAGSKHRIVRSPTGDLVAAGV